MEVNIYFINFSEISVLYFIYFINFSERSVLLFARKPMQNYNKVYLWYNMSSHYFFFQSDRVNIFLLLNMLPAWDLEIRYINYQQLFWLRSTCINIWNEIIVCLQSISHILGASIIVIGAFILIEQHRVKL